MLILGQESYFLGPMWKQFVDSGMVETCNEKLLTNKWSCNSTGHQIKTLKRGQDTYLAISAPRDNTWAMQGGAVFLYKI